MGKKWHEAMSVSWVMLGLLSPSASEQPLDCSAQCCASMWSLGSKNGCQPYPPSTSYAWLYIRSLIQFYIGRGLFSLIPFHLGAA